jgi:S-formylglutathione hydrolase FrmB
MGYFSESGHRAGKRSCDALKTRSFIIERIVLLMILLSRARKIAHAMALACAILLFITACNQRRERSFSDHPRLTSTVRMQDVTFHSSASGRDTTYRVVLPASIQPGSKFAVVYLLHGANGSFRDWSNYTDVARFAERALILVMPDGDDSWYTNSAEHLQDRYEDYITRDLVADVESRFPAATGRTNRAIVGISMGGFGAVKLALRHPDLFAFAGGLSSALDVPGRPFSVARIGQYRHYRSIFGPSGSASRRENDPFVLASSADPAKMPYFFLTCGDNEGLLSTNRSFAQTLERRHFPYEFHIVPGGHDWSQWNATLDGMFSRFLDRMGRDDSRGRAITPSFSTFPSAAFSVIIDCAPHAAQFSKTK